MAQQPQNGYRFPENIGFRSRPHRLLYDPGNPNTVMPDLSGAQIVSLRCEPVTASSQRLYMTYIELQIPARAAGGRVFAAKHIVGFRAYTPQEAGLSESTPQELARKVCQQIAERTPPQEMAMYIREGDPQAGSPAQELLDAIMGESVAQAPQANTQWAQQVFAEVGPQRPEAEAAE